MWIIQRYYKFERKVEQNPVRYGIFTALFLFISRLKDIWGLFSNEPIVPTLIKWIEQIELKKHLTNIVVLFGESEMVDWVVQIIAILMLAYIIYLNKKPKPEPIEDIIGRLKSSNSQDGPIVDKNTKNCYVFNRRDKKLEEHYKSTSTIIQEIDISHLYDA